LQFSIQVSILRKSGITAYLRKNVSIFFHGHGLRFTGAYVGVSSLSQSATFASHLKKELTHVRTLVGSRLIRREWQSSPFHLTTTWHERDLTRKDIYLASAIPDNLCFSLSRCQILKFTWQNEFKYILSKRHEYGDNTLKSVTIIFEYWLIDSDSSLPKP
jgi:hypothetical protein